MELVMLQKEEALRKLIGSGLLSIFDEMLKKNMFRAEEKICNSMTSQN